MAPGNLTIYLRLSVRRRKIDGFQILVLELLLKRVL